MVDSELTKSVALSEPLPCVEPRCADSVQTAWITVSCLFFTYLRKNDKRGKTAEDREPNAKTLGNEIWMSRSGRSAHKMVCQTITRLQSPLKIIKVVHTYFTSIGDHQQQIFTEACARVSRIAFAPGSARSLSMVYWTDELKTITDRRLTQLHLGFMFHSIYNGYAPIR